MRKILCNSNCGIIDKIIPTPIEIYEYKIDEKTYKSEWYLNLTKEIEIFLKKGCRDFTITATPSTLLAAEYILQQKKRHIRYCRVRFHLIIPNRDFVSFFDIKISKSLLNSCDDITIFSFQYYKNVLLDSVQYVKSRSDFIFQI